MGLETLKRNVDDTEQLPAMGPEIPPELDEVAAPTIYPTDPSYGVTVYYEASRFPNDQAVQDLFDRMGREYAPRSVGLVLLDPTSLEYASLSPFPEMEKLFFERGYVADVEGRIFRRGQVARTRFAKRNIAAINGNAMAMASLLYGRGHNLLQPAEEDDTRLQQVHRTMAPVLGKETVYRTEPLPDLTMIYPLAEHAGLLLGCTNFVSSRRLHFAYETTPALAIDEGSRKLPRESLFQKSISLIKKQLEFEAQHAHQLFRREWLFPGRAGAIAAPVNPTMMIVWYSQAIAAIRKVTWLAAALQESSVVALSLYEERAEHGHVIGANRLPDNARSWDVFIRDCEDKRTEEIADRADDWGPIRGTNTHSSEVSWSTEILAALMGATYRSDTDYAESPYQNPDIFVRSLAYWIGSLKRKRRATLDWFTAEGILELLRRDAELNTLLLSQFPQPTWERLAEISDYLVRSHDAADIEVSYAWTRDLAAPYKYEEPDDSIALEGPLLCFPVLETEQWQEHARTITGIGGFEFRGRDR